MWLILQDGQWGLPIRLDDHTREVLRQQVDFAEERGSLLPFAEHLSIQFARALQRAIRPEFRLPTARQMEEAAALARMLGLSIPPVALTSRASMQRFLQNRSSQEDGQSHE